MACCISVACFFCSLCIFIGLISLLQLCLGVYVAFIQPDIITINRLIKTDKFDAYLFYIVFVFIGLGLVSFILSLISIYSIARRTKSLSLFVSVLWIFAVALNIILFIISILYYFLILPQLRPLLVRTLQQAPLATSNLLDTIQSKYTCCGINGKDDYNNLPLDPYPSSCCRVPNCWRDTDINNNNGSNNTILLMHKDSCYSIINKYVTIELWIFSGITAICAFLQILAISFMCTLYQRYKKLNDDDPKFIINHLTGDAPINDKNNNNIQGSSQTIEETVEITQI